MLDHVPIGARNADVSKRFYDAGLGPLGYSCLGQVRFARLWRRGHPALGE